MTSYSFPILRMDVIKEELKVFQGLEITIDDMKSPKPDKVKEIYKIFLEELGINVDDLNQMQFRGSENIENPEQHEKSIPLVTLAIKMERLMSKIGVPDFCIKDLFAPDSKRFKRNLSALINFWKFVESHRLTVYSTILEKQKAKSMKKDLLLEKKDDLKRKINRLKLKHEEELPQIKLLEETIGNLVNALSEAKKVQQKFSKEISSLKTETAEIEQSMENIQVKINKEQEETIKLEGMLVKSPDRVAERRDNLIKEIEMAKERIQQKNNRLLELQCDTENYKTIFIKAQCIKNILEIIQNLYKREKDISMEIEVQENDKYLLQTRLNQKMMDVERLQKILMSKEEEHMRLELQHKSKMTAIKGIIKDLEKEEDQLSLQKSQDEVVQIHLTKEIQNLKDLIEKNQEKTITDKKELENKFSVLCQEVTEKTMKLSENFAEVARKMKEKEVLRNVSNIM